MSFRYGLEPTGILCTLDYWHGNYRQHAFPTKHCYTGTIPTDFPYSYRGLFPQNGGAPVYMKNGHKGESRTRSLFILKGFHKTGSLYICIGLNILWGKVPVITYGGTQIWENPDSEKVMYGYILIFKNHIVS